MVADLRAGERLPAPGAPGAGASRDPRHPCREIDASSLARRADEPNVLVRRAGEPNVLARRADEPNIIDWHGFHVALRRAALAATQSGAPLSLLMLELAPREPGAPARERLPITRLVDALAGVVATELEPMNALARYDEECLAVILTEADLGDAIVAAERIGRRIAPEVCDDLPPVAAIGVAQFRDDESLGHLIERVTDALGRAWSDGRQVAVAEHRLRRRPWPAARGANELCLCGRYACPCACGLV